MSEATKTEFELLGGWYSDRGFKQFQPVTGVYDSHQVRVYESSSAESPHIWLAATNEVYGGEVKVLLDLSHATDLRDQLTFLIENHYHNE